MTAHPPARPTEHTTVRRARVDGPWRVVVIALLGLLALAAAAAAVGIHLLLASGRDVLWGEGAGGAELGMLLTALSVTAGIVFLGMSGRTWRRSESARRRRLMTALTAAAVLVALGAGGVSSLRFLIVVSSYTQLHTSGCDLVVAERSFLLLSSITIMRRDGLLLEPLEHTGADDGYAPFAADQYVVMRDDGNGVALRFLFENGSDYWKPVRVACDGSA